MSHPPFVDELVPNFYPQYRLLGLSVVPVHVSHRSNCFRNRLWFLSMQSRKQNEDRVDPTSLVDPTLDFVPPREAQAVWAIALECVSYNTGRRPTMDQVKVFQEFEYFFLE